MRALPLSPPLSPARCAYRLEPGFLVQGSLAAGPGVKANRENPRAPKVMERGEVGWAGGGKGPDYFIYMGSGPAGWLGVPHEGTIFAEVADLALTLTLTLTRARARTRALILTRTLARISTLALTVTRWLTRRACA